MLPIILASSSAYRHQLLSQLQLPFSAYSPNIDESRQKNEPAAALVERLAIEKAQALRAQFPHHLIIGSDQVGAVDHAILTKPQGHDNAVSQLLDCSGQTVTFHTGICLLNSASNGIQHAVEPFTVTFRHLNRSQIERYLHKEKPYDCAGSFKVEGLGISLFSQMAGKDYNALKGLPLIRLVSMLNKEGYSIP